MGIGEMGEGVEALGKPRFILCILRIHVSLFLSVVGWG